jgi:hypothetical protein
LINSAIYGRTIGDSSGKATYFNYNGVTINDYCLCSSSFMENVTNFKVEDFDFIMLSLFLLMNPRV